MSSQTPSNRQEPDDEPDMSDVVVTDFGGIQVAYIPGDGESWITGWVDVPR